MRVSWELGSRRLFGPALACGAVQAAQLLLSFAPLQLLWQANYRHQRHLKRASQLTRLKRWKPLAPAFASKLRKLGFKERYWAPPNAQASACCGALNAIGPAKCPYSARLVSACERLRCALYA